LNPQGPFSESTSTPDEGEGIALTGFEESPVFEGDMGADTTPTPARDDNKRRRRNRYRNRRGGRERGPGEGTGSTEPRTYAESADERPSASPASDGDKPTDKKDKPSWWEKIVGAE
jgi:hypothetical protein